MTNNDLVEKQKLVEKEYYHYWNPLMKVVFLFMN